MYQILWQQDLRSDHAVGTSKAIEIGEVEGAMSGLAIGICGIITVLFSMLII